MSKKARKIYDDDDGRVIAPMNVEGMPWYNPRAEKKNGKFKPETETLSKKETFKMMMRLYAVVLPVAFVFIAGFAALILFMVFVWFR